MSSARLCSLVAELGYEGAGKLDPDSFEWPFQYDDARPILDWICSSLRPSNVLSLAELSLYEQFQRDGKLLEGDDLDQAYDSISAFSSRRNNQEAVFGAEESIKEVRDATLAHKAEALELQRQLRRLQTQYDLLTGQSSALIQGRRARVAATSAVSGQITAIEDSLSARNLQMNGVLGRLASTSQELAHYHSGEGVLRIPSQSFGLTFSYLVNYCKSVLKLKFLIGFNAKYRQISSIWGRNFSSGSYLKD
jgi:HAUS augmin-like complex subunit 3